jgi:ElaB/YqjD/DUF883 family membrane-anchored ribosome-binding protein
MTAGAADRTQASVRSTMDDVRDKASAYVDGVGRYAEDRVDSGRRYMSRAARRVSDRTRGGVDAVEEQVEAHPFAGLAIAFGAGLLVGRLLMR